VNRAFELDIPMVTEQFVLESIRAQTALPTTKFLMEKEEPPYNEEYFCGLMAGSESPEWYKNREHWAFVVNQWFRGAPVDSYWALLGAKPVAFLPDVDPKKMGWPAHDQSIPEVSSCFINKNTDQRLKHSNRTGTLNTYLNSRQLTQVCISFMTLVV